MLGRAVASDGLFSGRRAVVSCALPAVLLTLFILLFQSCSSDAAMPGDPGYGHQTITVEFEAGENVKCTYRGGWVTTPTLTFTGTGDMYDYELLLSEISTDPVVSSDDDESSEGEDPRTKAPPWSTYRAEVVTFSEGITHIGKSTLRYNREVTSVTLPSTLLSIGQNAFSGTSITAITIPESVVSIGNLAFSNSDLVDVVIPDSVVFLGASAFAKCIKLQHLVIGSGVTEINQGLFGNTPYLESVVIGSGVQNINRWLTTDSGLRSLYVPASVKWISPSAFCARSADALEEVTVDPDNPNYVSIDGRLFDKECLEMMRYLPASAGSSYTIPDTVKYIGDNCFLFAGGLEHVILPDGLEFIGSEAFTNCYSLKEMIIPDTVTQIAKNGISTGGTLDILHVGEGIDEVTSASIPSISDVRVFSVGTSVEKIDTAALQGNAALESVEIDGDNIHYASAFGILYNANITQLLVAPRNMVGSVTLPESVTHIADNAFIGSKLEYVVLDGSIQVLGNGCFKQSSLRTIIIPDTVKIIGNGAFEGCSDLSFMYFLARNPPSFGVDAFSTGGDLRMYSPMAKGFADPYSSDASLISYYESDVFYTDAADKIMHGQIYIILIILAASVGLVVGERLLFRRHSGN